MIKQARRAEIFVRLMIYVAITGLFTGCGYTLQGSGSILPEDVKVVSIPVVENNTTEPSLSINLTEALRDRFERFGVFSVVDDTKEADAVLEARIVSLSKTVRSVTSKSATALQYDTTLRVSAVLKRTTTGEILWRNPSVSAGGTSASTGSVVVTTSPDFYGGTLGAGDLSALGSREVQRGQEQESLLTLADEIAKRIYNEAVAPDF